MTEQRNPSERLRELAEKVNLPFDELIGDLLSAPAPQAVSAARVASTAFRLSDAAIRAAISDSYLASDIEAIDSEREILDHSEVIMIGGRRRLRLFDSARGAILREAISKDRFRELLNQAIATDKEKPADAMDEVDSRSACLRRFLNGETNDLASASPAELRAAVAALERLQGVTLAPVVPSLADTQRLLERAEMLEPLRISIGATGEWDGAPIADRFVGRDSQLRILRSFVDEIASESTLESLQRNLANVKQTILRRFGDEKVQGVRFIVARGGLGKSALIAKFVLDHALRQTRQFPFAYLDFDSAAIQARDPRYLLLDVARQVALQYSSVGKELGDLRGRIQQSISGMVSTATADVDPFDDFRQLVRGRITSGERALLVVLDTVEIVQCDPPAMRGLLAFLERLSRGGFTELRIVAAGRAEVPELIAGSNSRHEGVAIKLDPLSEDEARDMVQRLGSSLLRSEWKGEWTDRLAGRKSDQAERREPLSLRVAVETMRDEAPQKRDSRSLEIERLGEDSDISFVGTLYESRVVGHVAGGEEVRKVAWPGLVVRRVSVEIIRDLLAPLLNLDPSRAQSVFDALATQVWVVVHDGDTLRHQQDLRARTLPLMRRKAQFKEINTAAIEYFGSRKSSSLQNRVEWIYHRLLGGESPAVVDADWSDSLVTFLRDAYEDFPPTSPAADYLAARTSDRLLPDELLGRLDPRLAVLHLARVGPQKGSLTDRTIDPLLVELPLVAIPPSILTGSAAAVRVSLLVKTGRWSEADGYVVDSEGSWQQQAAAAIAFRRARMMSPGIEPVVAQPLMAAYSQIGSTERASLATLIQDLAASRIYGLPIADQLDGAVTRRLGRGVSMTDSTIRLPMLRTAMLFGYRAIVPAARLWVAQLTEKIRASEQLALSGREMLALSGDEQLASVARKVLEGVGLGWEEFLSVAANDAGRVRLDDPALGTAVCDALRRRCESGGPEDLHALRVFASGRDEDWLTPLAYAAYRATGGKVPKEMADLYENHQPGSRGFLRRNLLSRTSVPTDILEVLRRADEASDVAGAGRLFLQHSDERNAKDLKALLEWYHSWRTGVQRILEPSSDLRLA